MSDLKCLLCSESLNLNSSSTEGEAEKVNDENDYTGPKIGIPVLCRTLQLATVSFTEEEYSSFKAPICPPCDNTIKNIQNLLEDLKNIETHLSKLRKNVKTQLSDSLQASQDEDTNTSESEIIRLKIFTDLAKVTTQVVAQPAPVIVKQEPAFCDSNNEDDSMPDFNETFSNEDSAESPNNVVIKTEKIVPKLQHTSKYAKRKKLKIKVKKSKIKEKSSKKSSSAETVDKDININSQSVNENENDEDTEKQKSNVSRSGRPIRSTVRPEYLYKGEKSVYNEDGSSDEEKETPASRNIKTESMEDDTSYAGDDGCSDDNLEDEDDRAAGSGSDMEEEDRSDQDPEKESSDSSPEAAEERPRKIRKRESRKTDSSKKRKKGTLDYKHIIDPELTMDQIKLIGSDKKLLASDESLVTIGKNGKKSINMSKVIKDESVAFVKIKEKLYGKRYACHHEGCGKTFTDKESRDIHFKKKHENNPMPYECDTCHKSFRQKRTLLKHMEFLCQENGETSKLPKRKRNRAKAKTHSCQYCPEKWRSPSELMIHVRKAHTGETPFQCQYCELSFVSALRLEFHTEQNHHEVAPLKCEFCCKGFFREHRLKSHIVVHTGEKPYLCEVCCRSFALKNQLTFHQAIHDEQKAHKFRCEECNKNFASPQNLKQHIKSVHEKVYRFICEICNHGSAQMSTHRVHMRTHTGEKPFQCSYCEKAYINGAMLKIHIRNHTGERPYVCHTCGKGFTVRSKLQRHELIHLGERPFQCHLCLKGFTTNSYLKSHLKNSH